MKKIISLFLISILHSVAAGHLFFAFGDDVTGKGVRPSIGAGSFYPGSPAQLRSTVSTLLDAVPPVTPAGKLLAAVAPHAGYVFSGGVAAHTFKLLSQEEFDTLIIIGHDSHLDAVAFTGPWDYFETPLGKVPVDRDTIEDLHAFHPGIKAGIPLHARDHTIEVQLPFLQVLGKRCMIVPILFGNPTVENCRLLSDAILASGRRKKLFLLASTDLSHYPSYDSALHVDQATLEAIKTLDILRLFAHLSEEERKGAVPDLQTAMCARGGLGTAILFAKAGGADHAQVLRYASSGDVPAGGKNRVVGYSSLLFVKKGSP